MGLWSVAQPICRSGTPSPQGESSPEEPAGQTLLERLKLSAPIHAGLRLGEGTGGVLLLPMLDGALAVYNSSHKFDQLPMEKYTPLT